MPTWRCMWEISTHALREEGDLVRCKVLQNDG